MSVNVSASPAAIGVTFDAKIDIAGVADLYAFEFDLAFNPTVVRAVSVSEGPFLSNAGVTLFLPGTIDNLAGTVAFTSSTLIGAIPGATGSGTLAALRFSTLAPGA